MGRDSLLRDMARAYVTLVAALVSGVWAGDVHKYVMCVCVM